MSKFTLIGKFFLQNMKNLSIGGKYPKEKGRKMSQKI